MQKIRLSAEKGAPTRQLFYTNGQLFQRDYYDRSGWHATSEFFNPAGEITESIYFNPPVNGQKPEYRHWWYEDHIPVKCIRNGKVF